MPSTNTITAYYSFTANTVIRSAYVNTNFSNHRGHVIPINTDTATASDMTHDLGGVSHSWRGIYGQYGIFYQNTAGSVPAAPIAGSIAFYFKTDGKAYIKLPAGSESALGGATTVTGTRAAPQSIVAGTGIAFTGTDDENMWFIQGSGGAVTVSANPQIAAGSVVGQKLELIGRSATNTVTLQDGTGLSLNGTWVGGLDSVIGLRWDGTNWVERYRCNP